MGTTRSHGDDGEPATMNSSYRSDRSSKALMARVARTGCRILARIGSFALTGDAGSLNLFANFAAGPFEHRSTGWSIIHGEEQLLRIVVRRYSERSKPAELWIIYGSRWPIPPVLQHLYLGFQPRGTVLSTSGVGSKDYTLRLGRFYATKNANVSHLRLWPGTRALARHEERCAAALCKLQAGCPHPDDRRDNWYDSIDRERVEWCGVCGAELSRAIGEPERAEAYA